MVAIGAFWVPVILSAVLVFAASSIIHMLLGYHRTDFRGISRESDVMNALREFNLSPGEYVFPKPESSREMNSPEFVERMTKGPVGFLTVMPSGPPSMGRSLVLWFLYSVVVGIFAAYISGHALPPGAHYLSVFRFIGGTAFMGYSLALLQNSIWYKRSWAATMKSMFDGLVYASLTAGVFGWLWPA